MDAEEGKKQEKAVEGSVPANESASVVETEIFSDATGAFEPGEIYGGPEETYGDIMEEIGREEKEEIVAALRKYSGNITKAAASLGMSRQSLSYRMKKYRLR